MTAKSQNAMGQIRRPTIASTAGEGWGLGPADGRITKAHGGEVQMIDRSIVRVHQHASGVKKRAEIAVRAKPRRESNHGGGRSLDRTGLYIRNSFEQGNKQGIVESSLSAAFFKTKHAA